MATELSESELIARVYQAVHDWLDWREAQRLLPPKDAALAVMRDSLERTMAAAVVVAGE